MATTTKKGWGTAPFWVDLVAVIALSKAAFVLFMGVIGVAASTNISNQFGVGMIVFGAVYALIALLLVRGSRIARDLLALLSAASVIIAIVWASNAPNSAVVEALVTLGFAVLVLVLLFVPESVKEYFRKA